MTTAPQHLTELQAQIYQDTLPRLRQPTTHAHLTTLEAYAIQRARWMDAEKYLAEHGNTITLRSDKGTVIKIMEAPQLKIAANAQDRALQLAGMLKI